MRRRKKKGSMPPRTLEQAECEDEKTKPEHGNNIRDAYCPSLFIDTAIYSCPIL